MVANEPEPNISRELKDAILMKVVFSAYAHASDTLLNESIEAEYEADWWAKIGRDTWSSLYYLLQSQSVNHDMKITSRRYHAHP